MEETKVWVRWTFSRYSGVLSVGREEFGEKPADDDGVVYVSQHLRQSVLNADGEEVVTYNPPLNLAHARAELEARDYKRCYEALIQREQTLDAWASQHCGLVMEALEEWMKNPLERLPQDEVDAFLHHFGSSTGSPMKVQRSLDRWFQGLVDGHQIDRRMLRAVGGVHIEKRIYNALRCAIERRRLARAARIAASKQS